MIKISQLLHSLIPTKVLSRKKTQENLSLFLSAHFRPFKNPKKPPRIASHRLQSALLR